MLRPAARASGWEAGVSGQLPAVLQDPLVVILVEATSSQAKSFPHRKVDLPGNIVVSSVRVSPNPEAPDVCAVNSHHSIRVPATFRDLRVQLLGDREHRIGGEQATS